MKVGILTFHNAFNFGAILQTYATSELVKSYGHEAEVINYHNQAVDKYYDKYRFSISKLPRNIKYVIAYLFSCFFFRRKERKYKLFIENFLNLSLHGFYEPFDKLNGYDVVLIGSDQLWNKGITGGIDPIYWGAFVLDKNSRKVTWSVSMNDYDYSQDQLEQIQKYLNGLDKISVREPKSRQFLSKLTDHPILVTLDPTLLISSEQWERICKPVNERNYIAMYAVKDYDETYECARIIAKEKGLKVIVIKAYCGARLSKSLKQDCGPVEFLSYLYSANYVVTSSFHGTVFSILFKKDFTCVVPKGVENVRTESLLNSLGLSDRIGNATSMMTSQSIEYNKVMDKLDLYKSDTYSFISDVLSGNAN